MALKIDLNKMRGFVDRLMQEPVEDPNVQKPVSYTQMGERRGYVPPAAPQESPRRRERRAQQPAPEQQPPQQEAQTYAAYPANQPAPGYEQGYQQTGYQQTGYQQTGYQQTGYQQTGYQAGFAMPGQGGVPYAEMAQPAAQTEEEPRTPWWRSAMQQVKGRFKGGRQDVQDALEPAGEQPAGQQPASAQTGYMPNGQVMGYTPAQPAPQSPMTYAQPSVSYTQAQPPVMNYTQASQPVSGTAQMGYAAAQPGSPSYGQPQLFAGYQPQQGMSSMGMPQSGIPQSGIPQSGMPQSATMNQQPQSGMPQSGMPQSGMPQPERRRRSRTGGEQPENNVLYMDPSYVAGKDGVAYRAIIRVAQPTALDKCYRLIEFIASSEVLLVNLEMIQDKADIDRCLDVLYGAAYVMGYTFTRIAERCIYLIAPRSFSVEPFNALNQMSQRDAAQRWRGSDRTNPEDHSFDRERMMEQQAAGWGSAFRDAPGFQSAAPAGRYGGPTRYY